MNAEQWNALYPVGTLVFAYPGFRPEDAATARRLVTRTRTAAQVSAPGDPVVWVEGEGSYICLTHVDPVSEDVWEAARTTEEPTKTPKPAGAPKTVREKVAGLLWWSVPSGTDEEVKAQTNQLLDELAAEIRAEVLTEVKVEVVDWLVKKASEKTLWDVSVLASKVDRGAVRAFIGTDHYHDVLDAHRAEARGAAFMEAAAHFDRMADQESDQHGYRARVMRGAANDVRRLIEEPVR